jgi:Domain of unknown function (DUF4365)
VPLPREHLLDELATAYVQVLAATAGATIAVSRLDYGVDGTLKHIVKAQGDRFIESGFPVDFQLKGTSGATINGDHIVFDLKVRNYDLVATRPQAATPYYLFLVCFVSESEAWIAHDLEQLILRASAYWWTASGHSSANSSTVRIGIPTANRLTSTAVEGILKASRERFVL